MSSPTLMATVLARGVSELDLNKALQKAQADIESETGMRYTNDQLHAMRPPKKDGKFGSPKHVEFVKIEPQPTGILTPPNLICPAPPPNTPTTPHPSEGIPDEDFDSDGDVPEIKVDGTCDIVTDDGSTRDDEPVPVPHNTPSTLPTEDNVMDDNEFITLPSNISSLLPTSSAPAKKKKKKSSGVNRRAGATGFEEYYADPPITPAEFEEERGIYDESNPFVARIETCIQRYRARRNLDNDRQNILTKYLMLGGVESTAKAFTGGLDKETIDNATSAEIAALRASDYIRGGSAKYYDGSDGWVIDFLGVAKAFFSYRVPHQFGIDNLASIKQCCAVVRNFLNYVLYHRVCDEYIKDVRSARDLCNTAETELWAIRQLQLKMPGEYNIAACTLYGGRYQGLYVVDAPWALESPDYEELTALNTGLSDEAARRIFQTCAAFAGTDDVYYEYAKGDVHVVKTTAKHCEIVSIERADITLLKDYAKQDGNIKALGSMTVKYWSGPGIDPEDFSDEEEEATIQKAAEDTPPETLWLEDEILALCFVGLKMELLIKELNIGVKYFEANGMYCSFFEYNENEKMKLWKDPIPSTRPAPTEDNPDSENRAMAAEFEREVDAEDKLLSRSETKTKSAPTPAPESKAADGLLPSAI